MMEISQEFGFDAAHYLGNGAAENRRLHGHSFYAEVILRGQPNPATENADCDWQKLACALALRGRLTLDRKSVV